MRLGWQGARGQQGEQALGGVEHDERPCKVAGRHDHETLRQVALSAQREPQVVQQRTGN